MDRELLKHCLVYHGESLLNKLKCEQTENPGFQAVISDLCKASYERYVTKKTPKTCRPFNPSSFCYVFLRKVGQDLHCRILTCSLVVVYVIILGCLSIICPENILR